jgi:hypothetical protein
MNPPRFAEWLLRLVLSGRDRDTISGDLLEEYRDAVVPARGSAGARWWYRRQVASVIWRSARAPIAIGGVLGLILGAWILVDTIRNPLADDDAASMLIGLSSLMAVWMVAATATAWRTRRVVHALTAGVLVGAATMFVLHVAAITRVVVFVDTIQTRDDWRNLVGRYHASGFSTLRGYAVYEYVRQTPIIVAIGAVGGAVCGTFGGAIARLRPR